jgi:hypothetical protein
LTIAEPRSPRPFDSYNNLCSIENTGKEEHGIRPNFITSIITTFRALADNSDELATLHERMAKEAPEAGPSRKMTARSSLRRQG